MTTNKDWKDIEEEFITQWGDKNAILEVRDVLDFFKPYFQEELHTKAVESLEKQESSWEDKKEVPTE